ncbi:ABC transporter permease [Microbacterium azadirachtae]|uniref:Dipeptide transport system permease protein DppB n=1 Tax=Microbacterium azadirachtae TaxID=582680 RepID=A0A0F0KUU3_9MICO|nr:ABC transporter permease [Microbacterium azadirachtae]KJL24658.1 Dipeptide transport system permease protein DppB [Microbacterium azadirachtae]UXW85932.1 ABC transporter permease [Microbacterium azadirachtae]SDL68489.1 peptide/nickel transport system permease protein [Microbacterium azadirachtae]SEF97881.1 peptide/nickel transport system permease protein [Microbacterium azadirachtae]SEG00290.1 peptide/nickel transport system permease protein [Microbacterium azadirachtae]
MSVDALAADPVATRPASSGGGLWRYILIRLVLIIPTVLILVTLVFFLMRITGDPITAALGGRLPPDQLAARVHQAGYDRPVLIQYFEYLGKILQGDFGTTITDGQPVTQVLLTYGSATLELAIYALIVAFAVSIPLGLVAAHRRDKWQDASLRIMAILAYATPIFFVGLLLKLVFSVWLGWMPVSGRASTQTELLMSGVNTPTGIYLLDAIRLGNGPAIGDVLWHAILPALALGLLTAGIFLRLIRTNVIGTLGQQYVTSGRSRGVSEYRLVTKHAFRPALIPIITVMGLQIALLLSGAILTETTFEWKGIGFMLSEYLKARDFVAVQGIVVMIAVIVAVTNFIVDIVAAMIDPRVRY